jgi:hypothetical protein
MYGNADQHAATYRCLFHHNELYINTPFTSLSFFSLGLGKDGAKPGGNDPLARQTTPGAGPTGITRPAGMSRVMLKGHAMHNPSVTGNNGLYSNSRSAVDTNSPSVLDALLKTRLEGVWLAALAGE